ncbi:hypothetical protein ACFWIB_41915 [Streptomyces sp. NPDC127051]|uniref:hypothetical protein n=1 Tax=Streptomyces sp. NPDC127051 TaxID=3347119 RepID=UPI00365A8299
MSEIMDQTDQLATLTAQCRALLAEVSKMNQAAARRIGNLTRETEYNRRLSWIIAGVMVAEGLLAVALRMRRKKNGSSS